jgi:hypothetical protein
VSAMLLAVGEGLKSSRLASTVESGTTTPGTRSISDLTILTDLGEDDDYEQWRFFSPERKFSRIGGTPAKLPFTPAKPDVQTPPSLAEKAQALQGGLSQDAIIDLQVAPVGHSS